MNAPRNPVTIALIKRLVAEHYRVCASDLTSRRRGSGIAGPRQVAMYLSATMALNSLPEIGRAFVRDHTTVMHARDTVVMRMEADPEFEAEVVSLRLAILAEAAAPTTVDELAMRLVMDTAAMFRQAGLELANRDPAAAIRLIAPLAAAVGAPLPNEVLACRDL